MKPSVAGAAVFSGLAAVVAADALPMDSIPLQCVKVCGPIVELTNICNTSAESRRRALTRRKDVGGGGVKMRSNSVHGQQQHSHGRRASCGRGGQCGKREDEKRQFSVIRQAPTSFPPELLASLEEPTVAAQPSRINLVIVETESTAPTSTTAPPPPTDPTDADDANDDDGDVDGDGDEDDFTTASSTITSTSTVAGSTTAVSDEEPAVTETVAHAEADGDTEEDWWMPDDLEQQCVCSNKSFDVAKLTALCASCVDQSGDDTNNISIIVSTCRFPNETYSRDEDRVADGVRVKATKPTAKGSTTEEGGVLMAMNGEEAKGETVAVRYAMVVAGLLACAVVIA